MRVNGASPRRFLRFLSLTALRAEGCGITLRAISIKSALRVHLSVSYGMISILLNYLPSADTPPIRLRRTSPRESVSHDFQVALLPYESCSLATPSGGQNKTPRNTLFINGSTVSTGYCATACGGKVVAPATKGGAPSPEGRLYGFPTGESPVVKVLS